LIITGDNILTAAKVALNLKMGDFVEIIEKEGSNIYIEHEDGKKT